MVKTHKVPKRKLDYAERLNHYLDNYAQAITICVNNVGSKNLATRRKELRVRDIHILMGKNTIIRKVLNMRAERLEAEGQNKRAEQAIRMLDMVVGNVGFVFIPKTADIAAVRDDITSHRVQTAARAGIPAPDSVIVPAGPTGQDPSQTSFFQALDIPTKINRGQVEIVSNVQLITKGEKVSRSAAELLVMLNIKPFYYGIEVHWVYNNGEVFPADVLDISNADIACAFNSAVREVAALCLSLNYPTAASVPHSIIDAYKNMLGLGLALNEYGWDNLTKVKEILKDPSKFAAAAASPAAGAAPAADAAPAAAGADDDDDDTASSVPAGNMFGGGSGSDSSSDDDDDSS